MAMVLTGLAWMGPAAVAWAQEQEADQPPEILTSELALKTVLETEELEVDFVVVDTDPVTEVTINGEPQPITPADTVLVTRRFTFTQDVTRVRVSATDEAGHTKTVTYTVYRPGVDPEEAEPPEDEGVRTFATYDVRLEWDDNPTQDLSAPVSIGDLDLEGVVPDSEQDDTRSNLAVSGGAVVGDFTFYAGANDIAYSDEANEQFDIRAVFAGGSWAVPLDDTQAVLLGYTFTDINLGGFDYAQTHTLAPAWRTLESAGDGGTATTTYALDITAKMFARDDIQEDATIFALKREHSSLDAARQDSYRSVYQVGSASEGIEVTEFNFIALDWDWGWQWDSGLLWNLGTGVQYRDYANDEPLSTDTFLGDTRVDVPADVSTGLGYEIMPALTAMLRYSYTFNLSNKAPYERQILGIGVNGRF